MVYAQVKRIPGKPVERIVQTAPPANWDDSEDKELEWLARGASELARSTMQQLDETKAAECKKRMLQEMKHSGK